MSKFKHDLSTIYKEMNIDVSYSNFVSKLNRRTYFKEGVIYKKKPKFKYKNIKKIKSKGLAYTYLLSDEGRDLVLNDINSLNRGGGDYNNNVYIKSPSINYPYNLKELYDSLKITSVYNNFCKKVQYKYLRNENDYIKVIKPVFKTSMARKTKIQYNYYVNEKVKNLILENKETLGVQRFKAKHKIKLVETVNNKKIKIVEEPYYYNAPALEEMLNNLTKHYVTRFTGMTADEFEEWWDTHQDEIRPKRVNFVKN